MNYIRAGADQLIVKRREAWPHNSYVIEKYTLTDCDDSLGNRSTFHSGTHLILTYDWQKDFDKTIGSSKNTGLLLRNATEAETKALQAP